MRISIVYLGLLLSSICSAQVITGKDVAAKLPFWQWSGETISIRLVQRLPDQSRAYFAARGFAAEDVETIAQHCIFQTIVKNTSNEAQNFILKYDLNDWRIVYKEKFYYLKNREAWQMIWKRKKTAAAQSIAFNWSLLPSQQTYQAKDYNWGMTVFDLPHGARFNLELKWSINGEPGSGLIKNIQCAQDITGVPDEQ